LNLLLFQIASQNHYFPTFNKPQIKPNKFEDTKSEDINPKRTGNTMVKRKRTKRQTIAHKILHRKLKIEQDKPHLNRG